MRYGAWRDIYVALARFFTDKPYFLDRHLKYTKPLFSSRKEGLCVKSLGGLKSVRSSTKPKLGLVRRVEGFYIRYSFIHFYEGEQDQSHNEEEN